MINFFVPGLAIPQGSKSRARSGHMYEANKALPAWRQDVVTLARQASSDGPILGPVRVRMRVWFPRPKAHYRTGRNAHLLKDSAPTYHATKPDTDKLQRALGDALKIAGVLRDDSQICWWQSLKRYADDQPIGMHVTVVPLAADYAWWRSA